MLPDDNVRKYPLVWDKAELRNLCRNMLDVLIEFIMHVAVSAIVHLPFSFTTIRLSIFIYNRTANVLKLLRQPPKLYKTAGNDVARQTAGVKQRYINK